MTAQIQAKHRKKAARHGEVLRFAFAVLPFCRCFMSLSLSLCACAGPSPPPSLPFSCGVVCVYCCGKKGVIKQAEGALWNTANNDSNVPLSVSDVKRTSKQRTPFLSFPSHIGNSPPPSCLSAVAYLFTQRPTCLRARLASKTVFQGMDRVDLTATLALLSFMRVLARRVILSRSIFLRFF